jgi:C1A family cysteine protease
MNTIQGHSLGAIKSPPDTRDYLVKSYLPKKVILPTELSYRLKMTPVKNQLQLGSCVAQAGVAVLEYLHLDDVDYTPDLSEMWLYAKCKKEDGNPNSEGTDFRTACNVMQRGVCEEVYYPYIDQYPTPYQPVYGSDFNSIKFRLGTYAAVSIGELKQALFTFSPLMVAIAIHENFDVDVDGFMFPSDGGVVGGHAICNVGFKNTSPPKIHSCCFFSSKAKPTLFPEGYYEFKNSWGSDWADKGYFKIKYNDLPKVFWEARSVVDEPK